MPVRAIRGKRNGETPREQKGPFEAGFAAGEEQHAIIIIHNNSGRRPAPLVQLPKCAFPRRRPALAAGAVHSCWAWRTGIPNAN